MVLFYVSNPSSIPITITILSYVSFTERLHPGRAYDCHSYYRDISSGIISFSGELSGTSKRYTEGDRYTDTEECYRVILGLCVLFFYDSCVSIKSSDLLSIDRKYRPSAARSTHLTS